MRNFLAALVVLTSGIALGQGITIKDGTTSSLATVKPASTAAVAADTSTVVTIHPSSVGLKTQDGLFPSTTGSFSGTPQALAPKNRLKVGTDSLSFYDPMDGSAVNSNLWGIGLTTANFTVVQAAGVITLDNAASVTASSGALLFSVKQFQDPTSFPQCARWSMKVPNQAVTNSTMEAGFFNAATNTTSAIGTITDGTFFRFTSGGMFAVSTYGSSDNISSALPNPNTSFNMYMVCRKVGEADFYVNGILQTTLAALGANPNPTSITHVALSMRTYTSGATASAPPQILIGEASVFQEDIGSAKSWGEQLSAATDRNAALSPVTTFLQTETWANSGLSTLCTLSNTTACYATLGGLFNLTIGVAGANTDYLIFAYQVPAGFDLYVTGVTVPTYSVTTAVTAASNQMWGVAINSSAASLATADAAATAGNAQTWSPRRIALATESLGLALGSNGSGVPEMLIFTPPLVIHSARYFEIIMRQPQCAVCAAGAIQGTVGVNGYFE